MDERKTEAQLIEDARETALDAAVAALRSIHKAKQVAGMTRAPAPAAPGGAAALSPATAHAPAPTEPRALFGDFLGELARVGLGQINDVLKLHGRYADDLARWYSERLLPKPTPVRPEPQLIDVSGPAGGEACFRFAVRNRTSRRAIVRFQGPILRSADEAQTITLGATFSPSSPELDPEQDWIVVVTIALVDTSSKKPLAPGRYVGNVDVLIGDRVTNALLLNLCVEAP